MSCRTIHVICNQDVVAGAQIGHQRAAASRQPGGIGQRAVATFDLGNSLLKGVCGWRAIAPVIGADLIFGTPRVLRLPVGHTAGQDGRSMVDRRIHRAVLLLGMATCVQDARRVFHGLTHSLPGARVDRASALT